MRFSHPTLTCDVASVYSPHPHLNAKYSIDNKLEACEISLRLIPIHFHHSFPVLLFIQPSV